MIEEELGVYNRNSPKNKKYNNNIVDLAEKLNPDDHFIYNLKIEYNGEKFGRLSVVEKKYNYMDWIKMEI